MLTTKAQRAWLGALGMTSIAATTWAANPLVVDDVIEVFPHADVRIFTTADLLGEPAGGKIVTLLSLPTHGQLAGFGGTWTYRPHDSFWSVLTDSFVYGVSEGVASVGTHVATAYLMATVDGGPVLFEDLEDALADGWQLAGGAEITPDAAISGSLGLAIDSGAVGYLEATVPCTAPACGGPQGGSGTEIIVKPPGGGAPFVLTEGELLTGASLDPLQPPSIVVSTRLSEGVPAVRVDAWSDAGQRYRVGDWTPLPERPSRLALHWWVGPTGIGGYLLRIDGRLVDRVDDLSNGSWSIAVLRYGSTSDSGASATWYLDDLSVWAYDDAQPTTRLAGTIGGDELEHGPGTRWTTVPACVLTSSEAALRGNIGLEVAPSTTWSSLEDVLPAPVRALGVRFRIRADPLRLDPGRSIELLSGSSTTLSVAAPPLSLQLEREGQADWLRLLVAEDTGTKVASPPVLLSDGVHTIEVLWSAAAGPAGFDGKAGLRLDGVEVATLAGLDTDGAAVAALRLGACGLAGAGALHVDSYEIWHP